MLCFQLSDSVVDLKVNWQNQENCEERHTCKCARGGGAFPSQRYKQGHDLPAKQPQEFQCAHCQVALLPSGVQLMARAILHWLLIIAATPKNTNIQRLGLNRNVLCMAVKIFFLEKKKISHTGNMEDKRSTWEWCFSFFPLNVKLRLQLPENT